jgi:hypothetical protein
MRLVHPGIVQIPDDAGAGAGMALHLWGELNPLAYSWLGSEQHLPQAVVAERNSLHV